MRLFVSALIVLLLASCGTDGIINQTDQIDQGEWAFTDVKRFEANVGDTLKPYNFYLLIRHGGTYRYQNLIMIVKTYF